MKINYFHKNTTGSKTYKSFFCNPIRKISLTNLTFNEHFRTVLCTKFCSIKQKKEMSFQHERVKKSN